MIGRKSEKRSANWRQDGHAVARDIRITRINQDDLSHFSSLFIPKLDLTAQADDVRA